MTEAAGPRRVELIVRHAYVITMDDDGRIFEDGAIVIDRGRIVDVGDDRAVTPLYAAARIVDARGAPAHPGFVECHLHASFQLFRSALPDQLVEGDAFDSFESRFFNTVNDEEEYLSVLLASIEMIRNGTTCFLEAGTVLAPEAAARAAKQVGIRAVVADAFIWDQPQGFAQGKAEEPACGACAAQARVRTELARAPKTREEALERMGGELARNGDPDALVTGHIAILGLGTASEALMVEAKRRADAAGVVLNLHQSYSPADTDADRQRFGRDPLVHLAEIGFLDRNVTFGHANHLTDAECDLLIERGTSIAWAPAASMMWGHGGTFRGRHAEIWRRGGNIALGSDSANWSNDFDLWRQASLAVMTAREAHEDRTYLVAEDGLFMATRGGARAAGLEDSIGAIAPGKRADIVIHTLDRPEMIPTTSMVRNLFYSSRSKSVSTVIVDGRIVMDQGVITTLDERRALREIDAASKALFARMGLRAEPNALGRPPRKA
jgi:cytosine/adenosine deaminase-related metal-dependent hydrolase